MAPGQGDALGEALARRVAAPKKVSDLARIAASRQRLRAEPSEFGEHERIGRAEAQHQGRMGYGSVPGRASGCLARGRAQPLHTFDDHMGVGAADAKAADPGQPARTAHRPGLEAGGHAQGQTGPVQARVGALKMQVARYLRVFERQHHLDHASDAGG